MKIRKMAIAVATAVAMGLTAAPAHASANPGNHGNTQSTIDRVNKAAGQGHQEAALGTVGVQQDKNDVVIPLAQGGASLRLAGTAIGNGVVEQRGGVDAVAQSTDQDGVRVSFVLPDASAPTSLPVQLDGVSRVEDLGAAGLLAYGQDGNPLAYLPTPWARDANGNDVATHYEVSGTTVTQVVEPSANAAYPIVADPSIKWVHWYLPEILFTSAETKSVRNPEILLALGAGICALVAAETLGVGCGAFAAESGAIAAIASNAYGDGECLALRYGVVPYEVHCSTGA